MANFYETKTEEIGFTLETKSCQMLLFKDETIALPDKKGSRVFLPQSDGVTVSDFSFGNFIAQDNVGFADTKAFRLFAIKTDSMVLDDIGKTIEQDWIIKLENFSLYDSKIVAKDFFDTCNITDLSPPKVNIFYKDTLLFPTEIITYEHNATRFDTFFSTEQKTYSGNWLKTDDIPLSDFGIKLKLWHFDAITFSTETIYPNIIKPDSLLFSETTTEQMWMVRRDSCLWTDVKSIDGKFEKADSFAGNDNIWLLKIKFPTDNITTDDTLFEVAEGIKKLIPNIHVWKPDSLLFSETTTEQMWMVRRDSCLWTDVKAYVAIIKKEEDWLFTDKISLLGFRPPTDTVIFGDDISPKLIPNIHVWKTDNLLFDETKNYQDWAVKTDSFLLSDKQTRIIYVVKTDSFSLSDSYMLPNVFGFDNISLTDKITNIEDIKPAPIMTLSETKIVDMKASKPENLQVADIIFMTTKYNFLESIAFDDMKKIGLFMFEQLTCADIDIENSHEHSPEALWFTDIETWRINCSHVENLSLTDISFVIRYTIQQDTLGLTDKIDFVILKQPDEMEMADNKAIKDWTSLADSILLSDLHYPNIFCFDNIVIADDFQLGTQCYTLFDSIASTDKIDFVILKQPDEMEMSESLKFFGFKITTDSMLFEDDYSVPPPVQDDDIVFSDNISGIIYKLCEDNIGLADNYSIVWGKTFVDSVNLIDDSMFNAFILHFDTSFVIDIEMVNIFATTFDTVLFADIKDNNISKRDNIAFTDKSTTTPILPTETMNIGDEYRYWFTVQLTEAISPVDGYVMSYADIVDESFLMAEEIIEISWMVRLDDLPFIDDLSSWCYILKPSEMILFDTYSIIGKHLLSEDYTCGDLQSYQLSNQMIDNIMLADSATEISTVARQDTALLSDMVSYIRSSLFEDSFGLADNMSYFASSYNHIYLTLYDSEQERDRNIAFEGFNMAEDMSEAMLIYKPDDMGIFDDWQVSMPKQDDFVLLDEYQANMWIILVDTVNAVDKTVFMLYDFDADDLSLSESILVYYWIKKAESIGLADSISIVRIIKQDEIVTIDKSDYLQIIQSHDSLTLSDDWTVNIWRLDAFGFDDSYRFACNILKEENIITFDGDDVADWKPDEIFTTDKMNTILWVFSIDNMPLVDISTMFGTIVKDDALTWTEQQTCRAWLQRQDGFLFTETSLATVSMQTRWDSWYLIDDKAMSAWMLLEDGQTSDDSKSISATIQTEDMLAIVDMSIESIKIAVTDDIWINEAVYHQWFISKFEDFGFIETKAIDSQMVRGDGFSWLDELWSFDLQAIKNDAFTGLCTYSIDTDIIKTDDLLPVDSYSRFSWIIAHDAMPIADSKYMLFYADYQESMSMTDMFTDIVFKVAGDNMMFADGIVNTKIIKQDSMFFTDKIVFTMYDWISLADFSLYAGKIQYQDEMISFDRISQIGWMRKEIPITTVDKTEEFIFAVKIDGIGIVDSYTVKVWSVKEENIITFDGDDVADWKPDEIFTTDDFTINAQVEKLDTFGYADIISQVGITYQDLFGLVEELSSIRQMSRYDDVSLLDICNELKITKPDWLITEDNKFMTSNVQNFDTSELLEWQTESEYIRKQDDLWLSDIVTSMMFWIGQEVIMLTDETAENIWCITSDDIVCDDISIEDIAIVKLDILDVPDISSIKADIIYLDAFGWDDSYCITFWAIFEDNLIFTDEKFAIWTANFKDDIDTQDELVAVKAFIVFATESMFVRDSWSYLWQSLQTDQMNVMDNLELTHCWRLDNVDLVDRYNQSLNIARLDDFGTSDVMNIWGIVKSDDWLMSEIISVNGWIQYQEVIDFEDDKYNILWSAKLDKFVFTDVLIWKISQPRLDNLTTEDVSAESVWIIKTDTMGMTDTMSHKLTYVLTDTFGCSDIVTESIWIDKQDQTSTIDRMFATIIVKPFIEDLIFSDSKLTNVIFSGILGVWDVGIDIPVPYIGLSGTQQAGSTIARRWVRI